MRGLVDSLARQTSGSYRPLSHRTDRLDGLDCGSTALRQAETGCLPACRGRHYCASPYVCRLVGARARMPDILTGGPSLLYAKRILPTLCDLEHGLSCTWVYSELAMTRRACRSICSIMYTNHSFPVKELPHPSKDARSPGVARIRIMCATHAQPTHAPPHDWSIVAAAAASQHLTT